MKKLEFKKGQKVNYTGRGFLGYDRNQTEMTIIEKVDHMSYKVSYSHFTMEVYVHEIES